MVFKILSQISLHRIYSQNQRFWGAAVRIKFTRKSSSQWLHQHKLGFSCQLRVTLLVQLTIYGRTSNSRWAFQRIIQMKKSDRRAGGYNDWKCVVSFWRQDCFIIHCFKNFLVALLSPKGSPIRKTFLICIDTTARKHLLDTLFLIKCYKKLYVIGAIKFKAWTLEKSS